MVQIGPAITGTGTLEGRVGIEGAWTGDVVLRCGVALARRIAGAMFATPPHEVRVDQIQDSVSELVNMIAGNVKSLLPEPCVLGLPHVRAGCDSATYVLRGPITAATRFESDGEPIQVLVVEDGGGGAGGVSA
jgi:chemotaxis protein CheX